MKIRGNTISYSSFIKQDKCRKTLELEKNY